MPKQAPFYLFLLGLTSITPCAGPALQGEQEDCTTLNSRKESISNIEQVPHTLENVESSVSETAPLKTKKNIATELVRSNSPVSRSDSLKNPCLKQSKGAVSCDALDVVPTPSTEKTHPKVEIVATRSSQPLPYGIIPVCKHFLSDPRRSTQKMCKGCENRRKGVYAFWNKESKAWTAIRPRPTNVKSYSICGHYLSPVRKCFPGPDCNFAHGQEELYIWTMDSKKGRAVDCKIILIILKKLFLDKSIFRPIYKKENPHEKENYRPITV